MNVAFGRRQILGGIAALPLLGATPVPRQTATPGLAITIDDFDLAETPLMSADARDQAIRAALAAHGIKAAGFVTGKYIANDATGRALSAWSAERHILGNHSFSHTLFEGADPTGFMADISRCERLLTGYPAYRKLLRFPYLAEGRTAEGRDELRRLLREHGYRNAHVTIDASDWYIDNRLRGRLAKNPQTDLAPFRRFYLSHIWDRALYYDGLARSLFGHAVEHTLLLHHRLATALFLGDLLAMFRERQWRLIDAEHAFGTALFAREYATLPAGQSLIWAAAKASGRYEGKLRFPPEDGAYEADKMDALGL